MKNKLLEMNNITKRFYATIALNNVSFDLNESEIHALVGENGAGKSTLMKILSGSYPGNSYEGQIKINGKEVAFKIISDAESNGIEMIYQEVSLHPELTIAENVLLGNLPRLNKFFINWKEVKKESEKYLKLVGLEIESDKLVSKLSTSQKQLVSIARALAKNPKILILDEPTSALTESEVDNLMKIIKDLKKHGISCIYITHRLAEVLKIADRTTVLRDGHKISTNSDRDINGDKMVEDMVGRKIENMYPKEKVEIGKEALSIKNFTIRSAISQHKNILGDVSFSVNSGEILGLGGLIGSGRSELVSAIFGAIPRKSGGIFIGGKEVSINHPTDAVKCRIGLLTEDRRANGYVGDMNVRENISLASFDKVFNKFFIKSKYEISEAKSYKERLNIRTPSVETNILNLSGGNQQKVVLSKWLMTDVKIIFMDEPTRGIDVGAKVEIYHIMNELVKKGVAIVMISSELPELLGMCDRLVILANGSVVNEFTRDEFSQEKFMKAATGLSLG